MATSVPAPTASNPLGGLLGGGSTGATNMTWSKLTEHERNVQWGQVNDVYEQILGRAATMAEAERIYNSGLSNYALGQQLMMSKEFRGSSLFHQLKQSYAYELAQFVGKDFKLKDSLVQSFAAHNYTSTDIQSWVYAHPHVYVRSNDYKSRVASFAQVYAQAFGLSDPYASVDQGRHRVDTNAKKPGIQGHQFAPNDPVWAHIHQAAMQFQDAQTYQGWLMNTQAYKQRALASIQPSGHPADAGLTLDSRGRPIQTGLAGAGGLNQSSHDIPQ